jgi:alternative sigma factor RpoH
MRAQAPHELQTSGDAMLTCSATADLVQYQRQLRGFPMLQAKEEAQLAKRWREHSDREAAHKLVTSHLRLVVPVTRSYRGHGLPNSELVSEGNIGLIQAVKGFDPERGLRFSTYAIWWIKAAIREYILRSWSLVKIGTTKSERILFHNLRKEKNRVAAPHDGDMHPEQVEVIAERLGVRKRDVLEMNQRLCGDFSLNVHLREPSTLLNGKICCWMNGLTRRCWLPRMTSSSGAVGICVWRLRRWAIGSDTSLRCVGWLTNPYRLQLWHRNLASRGNGCARSSTELLKRSAER